MAVLAPEAGSGEYPEGKLVATCDDNRSLRLLALLIGAVSGALVGFTVGFMVGRVW